MIYVEDRHKHIIKEILAQYPYTFYAYGSRVKGGNRPSSDLDICFMDTIPLNVQAKIEEDFEESNLPFRVELADYNLMSASFQNHIKDDLVEITTI